MFRVNLSVPSSGFKKAEENFSIFISWPLKIGPIEFSETSLFIYHYKLRKNLEERRFAIFSLERLILCAFTQVRGHWYVLSPTMKETAKVSVRMAWISFGAFLAGKQTWWRLTVRVSKLLKLRASLISSRLVSFPGRAKDLSAPRYIW